MIKDATDYHWAIFSGTHWLEQAGRGGPLNIWANEDDLIADVYKRVAFVVFHVFKLALNIFQNVEYIYQAGKLNS